jgi:hypothetical protein
MVERGMIVRSALVLAVFTAGVLAGCFGTTAIAVSSAHRMIRESRSGEVELKRAATARRFLERYIDREFGLSSDQEVALASAIDRRWDAIAAIRRESRDKYAAIMRDVYSDLSPVLDEPQRRKLEKYFE